VTRSNQPRRRAWRGRLRFQRIEAHDGSLNASGLAVARNALSGYITLILGALLGFVVTPILLHHFGVSGYGIWSLVLATTAYLGLLELGMGTATMTRAAALETSAPDALSPLFSTSLTLFSGVAVVGLMLTLAFSVVFPSIFDVPAASAHAAQIAFLLIGTWQSLSIVTGCFSALLLGTGRMYVVNLTGFTIASLITIGQALVAVSGGGIAPVAAVQLVGAVLTTVAFYIQVRRALPGVHPRLRLFDGSVARHLVSLGWRNSVGSVAGTLAFGSDLVLVGLLVNTKAAAGYAIAISVYTLVQRLASGVLGAIGPAHAHAAANASSERRFDLYCISLSTTLILAIGFALTVGVYASPLLHLWLGRYPTNSVAVITILCAVVILQAPGSNSAVLLTMSERASDVMRVTVAAATLNVTASIVFTATLGSTGPALGSLLAVTLFDALYFPHRICNLLGCSYGDLLKRVIAPLGLPVALLAGLLALGRVVIPSGFGVLAVSAVAGVAYCAALWVGGPVRQLRAMLRSSPQSAARA
jgi:O-antigen/teichoic acid export membrane protein